jgi:DNA-binding MarR family transcriptional regulator
MSGTALLPAGAVAGSSTRPSDTVPTEASDQANRLRVAVVRLARLLRQQNAETLGPTVDAALGTIERDGPLTFGELAAREQIAPPSVTRIATKLEEAGFVVRHFDGKDRRVCRLEVTPAGRDRVVANRSRRHAWLMTQLEGLGPDDLEVLARAVPVLERLSAAPAGKATP